MGLFRRSTIFHVEESIPDPEELKLRFRRRVLMLTVLGFLIVLGTPVARDLRPYLRGRAEARRFAEKMLEARTLAAASRMPVSLELSGSGQEWKRKIYAPTDACEKEAAGPEAVMSTAGVAWKLKAEQENGEALSGHKLCWHPRRGLLLNTVPLANAKLLVSLQSKEEGGPTEDLAYLLVTQGGAEMQTISH
jgi:hypothetical protein